MGQVPARRQHRDSTCRSFRLESETTPQSLVAVNRAARGAAYADFLPQTRSKRSLRRPQITEANQKSGRTTGPEGRRRDEVLLDKFERIDHIENGEERWQTLGSAGGVVLFLVAHMWQDTETEGEHIRIVSALRAAKVEGKSMNKA